MAQSDTAQNGTSNYWCEFFGSDHVSCECSAGFRGYFSQKRNAYTCSLLRWFDAFLKFSNTHCKSMFGVPVYFKMQMVVDFIEREKLINDTI